MYFDPDTKLMQFLPVAPSGSQPLAVGLAAYAAGDFAGALLTLAPLADKGDAEAQFVVGMVHAFGQDARRPVPRDFNRAWRYFHAATSQGHWRSAFNAGLLCLLSPRHTGQSLNHPSTTIVALLRLAAEWSDDGDVRERAHRLARMITMNIPEREQSRIAAAMNRLMREVGKPADSLASGTI